MRTEAARFAVRLAGGRHRSRGQALVEFAIVFPVFMLLVFGLIDVGRLVYVNNAIAEGAREGARWGSVAARASSPAGLVEIEGQTAALMAGVPEPTIAASCSDGAGNPLATCAPNQILTVEVTTTVSMLTPVIGQIIGAIPLEATSNVAVSS